MDTSGNLRMVTNEELVNSMELLSHPVEVPEDIPEYKLSMFRKLDKAGNRKARLKKAKRLGINWHEYQIYKTLL